MNISPFLSYGPLYTAVTTGFCGSLTTFSGWQLDIFESWINGTASHRDWFRDVSRLESFLCTLHRKLKPTRTHRQ